LIKKEGAMSEVQDIEKYVSQLKVVDLREGLKKRHLSYTGNKKDLAQRLAEAMLKEKQEEAAQVSLENNLNNFVSRKSKIGLSPSFVVQI
jgi:hypothetical protein